MAIHYVDICKMVPKVYVTFINVSYRIVPKGPKLVRLHMGILIGSNIAHWYDFCHIKNAKFALPPAMSHK